MRTAIRRVTWALYVRLLRYTVQRMWRRRARSAHAGPATIERCTPMLLRYLKARETLEDARSNAVNVDVDVDVDVDVEVTESEADPPPWPEDERPPTPVRQAR
ncbi:MAG: hypothetical protein QM639_06280 [Rhodocyclaceae bacterium]